LDSSLRADGIGYLNRIALFRGLPKEILTDYGSEFTNNVM